MKVFLSHSTKDKLFVQQLAAAIIGAGFEPWLCEVDIEKNDNFVAEIEKGLADCDVALVVWSPDAAASNWTTEEWTSVLSRQVKEQRVRLGIVMLREHPLPRLLRTKNYISAERDPWDGIRQTVDWLRRRESVQRLSGLQAPVYLPEYRPQDFVGRTAQLELLRNTFTAEPSALFVHGEPGIGKSTLALQFAWDAQKDFDAVIFQTCGQRPLDAITAELVERLPIDVKMLAPDKQREAAKEWLRQRQSLLILDDVWTPEARQLEPGPPCSVLYTSRKQSLTGVSSGKSFELEAFSEDECMTLFHSNLDPIFGPEEVARHRDALLEFSKKVEMLPIAVAVAASLLREKAAIRLDKGVKRIKLEALTDGVKDVPELFRKAIESLPEREQKLLNACAVCVQEGFWLPLAAQVAGLEGDEAEDAASALVHGSLLRVLDRDRQRFQMHALLRDQARAKVGETALGELKEQHAAALEGLFEDWETRWQECRECLEEVLPAATFVEARGANDRAWRLSCSGYRTGFRIGELEVALRIMQQEEELANSRCDRYALQASYGNQALILADWGRLEEALEMHKKQESICLELGGTDRLHVSDLNLAIVLYRLGRLDEACALNDKVERLALELGNKDSLAHTYCNQAAILKDWGRPDEALELLKKQEAICLELGNKDGLQHSYGNQARILYAWGHLDEALELLKKQDAICLELGNKSSLGYCYWIWGLLARALGDHATEKQKLHQALALFAELKMPIEHDKVQAEIGTANSE